MAHFPENLKYAKTHEWVSIRNDGIIEVGITDHAQEELGDLVFVQLPETGRRVAAGEACAVVESVKTASDLHSPAAGEIVEVNLVLQDVPESINDEPYGTWIFRVRIDGDLDESSLLDAAGYQQEISA